MKNMKFARKVISVILALTALVMTCPQTMRVVNATSIEELQEQIKQHQEELNQANQKAEDLKEKQSLIEEMIDDLNAEIINTMTCIGLMEDEIEEKEIEIATKELEIAVKQAAVEQKEQEYYYAKEQ